MPQQIKYFLTQFMQQGNEWHRVLLTQWPEIMGSLKTRTRLEKIYDNTVIIGVYESHWMQELYLLSDVLLETINQSLQEPYVKKIKFKLVEHKHNRKREKKVIQDEPAVVADLNSTQIQALNEIDDPQLREALMQFWSRCSVKEEDE